MGRRGDVGWVYTVHVPAGTCSPGEALAWELSQPPSVSHAPLAIDEDSGPAQVAVTVVEGYGRVAFPAGQDPVWQGGTNTRHDLAALALYGEVTLDITAAPAHGVAGVAGTTITYTPADDYCGPDTLSTPPPPSTGSRRQGGGHRRGVRERSAERADPLMRRSPRTHRPDGGAGRSHRTPTGRQPHALVAGGRGTGVRHRGAGAPDGGRAGRVPEQHAIRVRATDAQGAWVERCLPSPSST